MGGMSRSATTASKRFDSEPGKREPMFHTRVSKQEALHSEQNQSVGDVFGKTSAKHQEYLYFRLIGSVSRCQFSSQPSFLRLFLGFSSSLSTRLDGFPLLLPRLVASVVEQHNTLRSRCVVPPLLISPRVSTLTCFRRASCERVSPLSAVVASEWVQKNEAPSLSFFQGGKKRAIFPPK